MSAHTFDRFARATPRPLRITAICTSCLRGYVAIATGSEQPPVCLQCGKPDVRELREPVLLDRFESMPDREREWLRFKAWPKGHVAILPAAVTSEVQ
jgi:hypothetical protein